MAILKQGGSINIAIESAATYYIKTTGEARYRHEKGSQYLPFISFDSSSTIEFYEFGQNEKLYIEAISGRVEYSTTAFATNDIIESPSDVTFEELNDRVNGLVANPSNSPKSNTVSLFGDSYTFYQNDTDKNNAVIAASCWAYALAQLGDAVNVTNYAGVRGNNSTQMLARLQSDILDIKTDWVFGQVGVNDFYGYGFTAETVFNNVTNMIAQILANGSKVLWLNCFPQNPSRSGFSSAKSLESARYNNMLSTWGQDKEGLLIVDVYNSFVDKSDSTNGGAKTNYIGTDFIHLSTYGSWKVGELVVNSLDRYIKQYSNSKYVSPLTTGDYGSLNFSNFNGTGGALGTSATGVAPDEWILSRSTGEGSVVGVRDDDTYNLQITKAVDLTQSKFRLQSANLNSYFAGGEDVSMELVLSADLENLRIAELRVYLYTYDGTDFETRDWGRSYNGLTTVAPFSSGDMRIFLPTSIILPAPVTDVRVYIDISLEGIGADTIKFKSIRLHSN